MKTISSLLMVMLIATAIPMCAQDAALEERVSKLNGYVQDLLAAQDAQRKQIEALTQEVQSLRDKIGQTDPNTASAEDLRKLAEKIQEVDKKRADDRDLILKEIEELGKAAAKSKKAVTDTPTSSGASGNQKGYEYKIQPGDTLLAIVSAYADQGIKVTVDQIVKANPGLKPTSMQVGQKIFIPAPQ